MTDRELMQKALGIMEWISGLESTPLVVESEFLNALRTRLAQPEQREVEIEFKEWIHPHMGLVPVDPKTPLILKAVIREEA